MRGTNSEPEGEPSVPGDQIRRSGLWDEHNKMEIREYPSSVVTGLRLSAEFHVPPEPKPLCLFFHGWHMTAEASRRAGEIGALLKGFFLVNVDMRGRGGHPGKPDASGHELIDGLDALDFARRTWPEAVDEETGVFLAGGSGGGGNTLSLVGKAPDIFTAAVSYAGMSDYGLWYEGDQRGRYRDEMEDKGWIGGTPESNPGGYRSRGGLHVIENVITDLLVFHGRNDGSVPVDHAEKYEARAREQGKTNIVFKYNDQGHGSAEWPLALEHLKAGRPRRRLLSKGTLRVHSFLACRRFRLVLDDPSCMGKADYALDQQGRLARLDFSPEPGSAPVQVVTLRIRGRGANLSVWSKGALVEPESRAVADDMIEFTWPCSGPCTADVAWPE